jgi:5'-AMP-activated protein kinase catalytic alpha subunit
VKLINLYMQMRLANMKAGRKGNLNVATEVFQVAPSLHMVEVRKAKGDTLEFHKVSFCPFIKIFRTVNQS